MRKKLKPDEITGIIFFVLSAAMICASALFLCRESDIWYDEMFTLGLANQSLGELISITAGDVHPPLYYMIVKLFLTIGGAGGLETQITLAKLASVFSFGLCVLLSAVKIRKNFGLFASGVFSFLLVSMPQLSGYLVEMRMYGFAILFITTGAVSAYELSSGREGAGKNWFLLAACSLAACYTHYFACVAACMVYAYLFVSLWMEGRLRARIKAFLISGFACAACYLPWLLTVVTDQLGQVKENYWIQPVSLRTLGGCVKFLFLPSFPGEKINIVLAVVLFVLYVLLLGKAFIRYAGSASKQEKSMTVFAAGCVSVLGGIVLFGFAASIAIKPIFVYRYMLPAMGVFWLAFSVLLTGLPDRRVRLCILILLSVTGLWNFRAFYGEETWKRLQMEQARSGLAMIGEEDAAVFNFDQAQAVTACYLAGDTYLWYGNPEELVVRMFPGNRSLVEGEFSDEAGMECIKNFLKSGRKVWFLGSGNAREEICEKWEKEGILSEKKTEIMIERYWLSIYLLSLA